MQELLSDLKQTARRLLQSPGFTIPAVAALALGIATNTAIFSVVNTVLLKPFAFRDSARIVMFQNTFRHARQTGSAAPTEYNWWRRQNGAFQDVSAYTFSVSNWTGDSLPEQLPTMQVSAGFFSLCGANAIYGRTFTAMDDSPGAPKTVILAHSFWRRRFASDPAVIGRRMTLRGERHEIIGVLGPAVENGAVAEQSLLSGDIEIDEPPAVYIPLQLDPNSLNRGHYLNVAGRLRPGVTLAGANAGLQASYSEYARLWTDLTPGAGFGVRPLQDAIVGGVKDSLMILWAAVGLVLLIACANVANLLLARATGRSREIAIRAALGAGRARIIRQFLLESEILSLAGGVLGVAAGYAAIRAILTISPGIPRIGAAGANVSLDWNVVAFTLGLSLLTGLAFGLFPALRSWNPDLSTSLKENGRGGGTARRHTRTRQLLIATEMAIAVVLLIGAALLIRSFVAMRRVDPGFDSHHILATRISLTGPQFADPATQARVLHEGVRRVMAIPGVEAAATTCCVPMDSPLQVGFKIVGRPQGPSGGGVTGWIEVSAGYFETLRIPILRGRSFTARDESGPPVVVVNQALARRYWPNSDPLNGVITLGDDTPVQVIGVAADVRDRALTREPRPSLYVPSVTPGGLLRLQPWAWVVRTSAPPESLRSAIAAELREASGGLPVAAVRSMQEILSHSRSAEDFNTLVLTIFGGSALLLAAIGIYGLTAYAVAQRTREIGIRLALGAEAGHIRRMVLGQHLRLAAAGAVCGLVAAAGLSRLIAGLLFGVKPWDPLVFAGVPAILLAVALTAAWNPAMRASRVDAMRALRSE